MIGSSLLFVNDETSANIWMIDFAKTTRSESCNANLSPGENGYLAGLQNLISFIENINLWIKSPLSIMFLLGFSASADS